MAGLVTEDVGITTWGASPIEGCVQWKVTRRSDGRVAYFTWLRYGDDLDLVRAAHRALGTRDPFDEHDCQDW